MGKRLKGLIRIEEKLESAVKTEAAVVKQSMCSRKWCSSATKTLFLILFYYCFSITLTFYNKKYITTYNFPLSITMTHLVTKFIMAFIIREIYGCVKKERITLGWSDYVKRVAPPGIASSLDIALSNWSFEYITVSLYTMTKTSVIIFILFFSIVFRLEKMRWSLVLIVLLISGGLFMFTFESTQFSAIGFALALSASFISGLRWTLSQMVLQKDSLGLSHPLDMMYHMQPWMILTLLPLSASVEGVHISTTHAAFGYTDTPHEAHILTILFGGAFIAFGLEMSEFLLVSRTSSLTLSVSGIVKEIITLLLAIMINGDSLGLLNGIGLLICLCGILVHVIFKAVHADDNKPGKTKHLDDPVRLISRNGNAYYSTDGETDDDADELDVFNVRRDRLGIMSAMEHRTEL